MVGMETLKKEVLHLALYFLQDLHLKEDGTRNDQDILHTVIYASPGAGKTEVSKILAKIYYQIGALPSSKITLAKRSDFIGPFIGHTEQKTQALFKEAKGGVLFIDEVYSMGQSRNPDSFSKAAIDLLNAFLSENAHDTICLIAGYEEEIESCFFSMNPGLKSRFPKVLHIEQYTEKHLAEIFRRKCYGQGWTVDPALNLGDFFKSRLSLFPYLGRDIQNLMTRCKEVHALRIVGTEAIKKMLTEADLLGSLEVLPCEKVSYPMSMFG